MIEASLARALSNADEMQKHAGSFDFILDAVSANHRSTWLHLKRHYRALQKYSDVQALYQGTTSVVP